jgi:transcriptional regulator with XRE-family HTH domain
VRDLTIARDAKKLTWKDIAGATGVSQSTLTRLSQGRGLDGPGLVSLAKWAGLDLAAYSGGIAAEAEPMAMLTNLIGRDKRLNDEQKTMLETLIRTAYKSFTKTEAK